MKKLCLLALLSLLIMASFAEAGCGLFGRFRARRQNVVVEATRTVTVTTTAVQSAGSCANGRCTK